MRFHVLAVAHTQTLQKYCHCAYTMKVWHICQMMKSLGHEVIHYGTEGSDPPCDEHVDVVSLKTLRRYYKDHDITSQFFKFSSEDPVWSQMARRTPRQLKRRVRKGDIILTIWGSSHQRMCKDVGAGIPIVEFGIGYTGVSADYKVFESYAWMHWIYCQQKTNGSWYDAVIPNSFNPDHFTYSPDKDDYFLYLGRVMPNKGVAIAADVAERLGKKLIIAGQNRAENGEVCMPELLEKPHVEFVGSVEIEERRKLLSKARALFAPTIYIEPFGGVNVEAQMSGTPVITTDWGAYPETVLHGVTGFRCRTMREFLLAADSIGDLSPQACRKWAIENYSIWNVRHQYDSYFKQVYDLNSGGGWYSNYRDDGFWRRYGKTYPAQVLSPVKTGSKVSHDNWDFVPHDVQPEDQATLMAAFGLHIDPLGSVLDVGGGLKDEVAGSVCERKVVVDAGSGMDGEVDGCEMFDLEPEQLSYVEEKFDTVLMCNQLRFVHDPETCLRRSWEALNLGGTLKILDVIGDPGEGVRKVDQAWVLSLLSRLGGKVIQISIRPSPSSPMGHRVFGDWLAVEVGKEDESDREPTVIYPASSIIVSTSSRKG